jgi:hypothetical protein
MFVVTIFLTCKHLPAGYFDSPRVTSISLGHFKIFPNLAPRACDPREGTWGSGIIRFREKSDWPLIWNAQFGLSQDSWLPATDYPRTSRSFPRIAGSGKEIEFSLCSQKNLTIFPQSRTQWLWVRDWCSHKICLLNWMGNSKILLNAYHA